MRGKANVIRLTRLIRTRFLVTLERADGAKLVFIAARGSKRPDGAINSHRMYRLNGHRTSFNFTEEENDIWSKDTAASCLVKVLLQLLLLLLLLLLMLLLVHSLNYTVNITRPI
jgi:hypothetical protein